MNLAEARKILVRKFTNYRNRAIEEESKGVNDRHFYNALRDAAAALVDFQTMSKAKGLFRRERHTEITKRRDELFAEQSKEADSDDSDEEGGATDEKLPLIACYQRAVKELWEAEDQDYWERRSVGEPEDISAYVLTTPSCDLDLTSHRNQEHFGRHIFSSLYSMCRLGRLGKLQIALLYAFRDNLDRVVTGLYD